MVKDLNLSPIFRTMTISKKNSGRNNHNASKLIEKYNNLAREALSIGDDIIGKLFSTCRPLYENIE